MNLPTNLFISANAVSFSFTLEKHMPLSWVSSSLENGLLWFLGRGVFIFELGRFVGQQGEPIFIVLPREDKRGLKWSNVVTMQRLHEAMSFPLNLVKPWNETSENETVFTFNWADDFAKQTLGFLAYGLSDITVDLFRRGAKTVRAQYSMKRAQIWCDVGLDEKNLDAFANPHIDSYQQKDTIDVLPW